ncbi:MAG TPA: UDP-N-acetylglucosamine 2-epimerase (non-hydrolyzing), partial [Patescibacteria group bacterium]
MAPLIKEFRKDRDPEHIKVCVTAQHREMLDQVLSFFNIQQDYDLGLMTRNQSVFDITSNGLKALESVFTNVNPDMVFVQGDTTTTFVGALSAFYEKKKIVHIEAGLRSGHKYSPFPEEINRILVGHMADYHFAPTEAAARNLREEGITNNVWVVGNTGIDALLLGMDIIKLKDENVFYSFFNFLDFSKKIILVTGHRRESFGGPFESICEALKELSNSVNNV